MQPTEPSFPGTGAPGGTEVAVSQAVAESPDQPSASQVITQTMAPAEELLDIDKAGSLAPDIGSDLPEEDAYHSTVVGPLTALVSDELPSQELTEETTQEICRLLIKRLPESACGQEDAIAPIRANLWSVMLLGLRPDDLNSQHNLVSSSLHGLTAEAEHALGMMHFPKEDQRVLAADIKRTRQAYAMFKREEVMQIVSQVLERYCVGHGIRYKQGQNELIAPFVVLQDPPLPLPVLGLLFESFMSRFVSRWFVDDEIEALLVSYRVFRVLLFYVDPGLAGKLDEADFVPELYATAWLITLFSRNLSLDLVLRLWDVYLAVNDPALVFFLLAALLVRNRDTIINVNQAHMMPETVQGLNITDKQDLEELIVQAREMLRKFPASFLQTVRSCCSDHGNTPLDTSRSLFCEAVRCASIRPGELLERMSGRSGQAAMDADEEDDEGGEEGRDRSPCPMRPGPVDTVALDIRPLNEYESSGVGHLGKSLRLDPYLLYMDDVLEKWMQHFDGTRGTHVCLVDSLDPPPSPSPSPVAATTAGSAAAAHSDKNNANAWRGGKNPSPRHHEGGGNTDTSRKENPSIIEDPLWRRLLFGDGDAATGAAGEDDWVKLHEDGGGGSRGNGDNRREAEVGVETGGNAATQEGTSGEEVGEGFGAARAFAEKLHARGFPYVSILEGGMEGIVDHLRKAGSPLEPTVINHDPEAYQLWREAQAHRRAAHPPAEQRAAASRAGEAFSWRGKKHNDNSAAARETDWQHQQHQQQQMQQVPREANASEGGRQSQSDASQRRPEEHGHPKIGVMDRLGLARVRDGVTHSVGTVARTGAWAVRGGAGVVMPSIRSTDGGLQAGGEEGGTGEGPKHARTESGNIWEAEAAPPGARGGGLVDEDGRDVSAIFGAIRNAQVGVLGGVTRGVGTMRRTGAWAARGGAEIIHSASRPSSAEYSSGEGAGDLPQLPRLSPRSGCSGSGSGSGGGGGGGGGGGSGGGGSDGSSVRAGGSGEIGGSDSAAMGLMEPPFSVDEENDKEMLVVALKTAEENGHVAAAKALRARLGFIQGQALRTQLSRDGSGGGGGSGAVATVGSADAIVGIEKEVMMTFAELYD